MVSYTRLFSKFTASRCSGCVLCGIIPPRTHSQMRYRQTRWFARVHEANIWATALDRHACCCASHVQGKIQGFGSENSSGHYSGGFNNSSSGGQYGGIGSSSSYSGGAGGSRSGGMPTSFAEAQRSASQLAQVGGEGGLPDSFSYR
jgi:hypothetical protein